MDILKILVSFAAGVGIGIFAAKKKYEEHYKLIADSEIESVIQSFKEKEERNKKEEVEKTMYKDLADNYISSVPPEKLLDRAAEKEHPEDDIPEEPYQIASMDFFNDAGFDKVALTYFVDDDALVGPGKEKEDDILDIRSTIGDESIEILKSGFNDGSSMYVRNPKIGVDYEVTKTYASYKGLMLDD